MEGDDLIENENEVVTLEEVIEEFRRPKTYKASTDVRKMEQKIQ